MRELGKAIWLESLYSIDITVFNWPKRRWHWFCIKFMNLKSQLAHQDVIEANILIDDIQTRKNLMIAHGLQADV